MVNNCEVRSVPPSDPVYEDPGVTDDTHALVALEPFVQVTFPWLVVPVLATVIEDGVPGVIVESDVARLLADGVISDTVTELENACVEPDAFAAVTLHLKILP